jgi:hypothetical protein
MVMMVMVMVPKALSQVGWLHQWQSQSINRLKACEPKLPETESFTLAKASRVKFYSSRCDAL